MKVKIKSKKIKNRFIYGELLENKKSNFLAIFLSGFSGSKELPLFKQSSRFFFKKGYSVLRFNFCNDSDDKKQMTSAIKLEEMNFSIYTEELKNILDTLGKNYSHFLMVGHSFGAAIFVTFLSKYKKYRKNSELVLWDPSLLPWKRKWMEEDFSFDKNKNLYRSKRSKEFMNKTFYNECINIKNTVGIFRALNKESLIVAATKIGKKNAGKYLQKQHNKKGSKMIIIDGASHSFGEKRHQIKLFNETFEFLTREDIKIGKKNALEAEW